LHAFYSSICSYQLFQVTPKDKASHEALAQLEESVIYDFWTNLRGIGQSTDIMVPPTYVSVFVDLMHVFNIEYRVKLVDVQT
jgi:hypothetical protein